MRAPHSIRSLCVLATAAVAISAAPATAGTELESTLTSPAHNQLFGYFGGITAEVTSGAPVTGMQVALKQKMASGNCRSFNGTSFVKRACNKPKWLDATLDGATWSYDMPAGFLLAPSSGDFHVVRYVASSRAKTALITESFLETGRNNNRFEVVGGP